MKFTSQICTTREQSERLLSLGLKKETADMWYPHFAPSFPIPLTEDDYVHELNNDGDTPAWSLHRIWILMPKSINTDKRRYYLQMNAKGDIGYFSDNYHALEYFYGNETIYDDCISCIEWLIKEGYFPKEYLN